MNLGDREPVRSRVWAIASLGDRESEGRACRALRLRRGYYRDGMTRAAAVAGWGRRHPLLSDASLGLLAVALSTTAALYGPTSITHHLGLPAAGFAVFAVAVVTFRRRSPLVVFGVLSAATLLAGALGSNGGPTGGALLVAAWTLGISRPRAVALTACGISSGALLIRAIVDEGSLGLRAENVNPVILTFLAAAAAIAIRERRAYLAALVERADRAERTRESEGARRVAEERLRIARDLHDSLAHHMAVVNVQTGVAQHLLRSDPDAAGVALGFARTAAGQVLDELGTVLGVLRNNFDGESTEPAPTLARLAGLVGPLRAAGMDIRTTVVGRPRELPPAVDQAAYRLAQEALTNVQKHAAGSRVRLLIEYRDAALAVEIVNSAIESTSPARQSEPEVLGFGLAGMRERSAAVAGVLETGTVLGGGFRVFALLPTSAAEREPVR